jgi:hypothetical protein
MNKSTNRAAKIPINLGLQKIKRERITKTLHFQIFTLINFHIRLCLFPENLFLCIP